MDDKIAWVGERLSEIKAKGKIYSEQIEIYSAELEEFRSKIEDHTQARDIVVLAGEQAQKNFTDKIETLVTSAIRAVYDDRNFECKLILEQKRNKTECRIAIFENGEELNPSDDCGGGILDIISIGIKVVLWYLENPRSRNTLILDEPFRWLGALSEKAGIMVKELSQKLGLQFILVTHDDNLLPAFDSCYRVTYQNKQSVVEKII